MLRCMFRDDALCQAHTVPAPDDAGDDVTVWAGILKTRGQSGRRIEMPVMGGGELGSVSQRLLWDGAIVTHISESPLSPTPGFNRSQSSVYEDPSSSGSSGPFLSPNSVSVALRGQTCVRSVAVTHPAQVGKVEGSWVKTGSGFHGSS